MIKITLANRQEQFVNGIFKYADVVGTGHNAYDGCNGVKKIAALTHPHFPKLLRNSETETVCHVQHY